MARAATVLTTIIVSAIAELFNWFIGKWMDNHSDQFPEWLSGAVAMADAVIPDIPPYLFISFAAGAAFSFVVLRGWCDSSRSGAPAPSQEHQPISLLRRTLLGSRRRARADAIARWRRMPQEIQRDIDAARGGYDRGDHVAQVDFHDTAAAIAQRHPEYRKFLSVCRSEFAVTKWNILKRWRAKRTFGNKWRLTLGFSPPGAIATVGSTLDFHVDDINRRLDILEQWWKITIIL